MLEGIIKRLPGIQSPKSYLSFKSRLKWTAIILLLFLFLSQISIYGIAPLALERFQFYEIVLGSRIGTLMTLGIGPIVTASIILQLLVGSKIIGWDLKTQEGRAKFQGTQKLLTILFCFIEAFAFVAFGAIQPVEKTPFIMSIMILQLAFGGILVLFMDEVVSKWGIGSGVSLFIAAGVTKTIFVRALSPFAPPGSDIPSGLIPMFIILLQTGEVNQAILALLPLIATVIVFLIVVYVQAIKVEIPLAFASLRGFSRRWPLNFIYTSNLPVILVAALLANIQMLGAMMPGKSIPFIASFDSNGNAVGGILYYITLPHSTPIQVFSVILLLIIFLVGFLSYIFKYKHGTKAVILSIFLGIIVAFFASSSFVGAPSADDILRSIGYLTFMTVGAIIFSIFWVATSGMDAHSVAEQIEEMGMQIPGFRRDPRIIEQVLDRYIPVLAVLSGLFVGLLAAVADFTGAVGTGTGILLTVMIIYNLYEQISMRYVEDMHPALRKFFE